MSKRKSKHELRLNGLNIKIMSDNELTIYDNMYDLDNAEAKKICLYLVNEGFLKAESEDEISCTIIHP